LALAAWRMSLTSSARFFLKRLVLTRRAHREPQNF
jgi:hypothetical protein